MYTKNKPKSDNWDFVDFDNEVTPWKQDPYDSYLESELIATKDKYFKPDIMQVYGQVNLNSDQNLSLHQRNKSKCC